MNTHPIPIYPHTSLVLTGGGARAAYQAGVLKAVAEILERGTASGTYSWSSGECPFQSISGISAGAINAAVLAARARRFREGVEKLYSLWYDLTPNQVLKTDFVSMSKVALSWMRDLSLGAMVSGERSNYLLDVEPLQSLLNQNIDFGAIHENLNSGLLRGFAISATSYKTGTAITFFEGSPEIQPWVRSSRLGKREEIKVEHILASASIPMLFKPVRIGNSYYGDGGIRLRAPLSPAIHLGAERIFAIGIRYFRKEDIVRELNESTAMSHVTAADISGTMLNATFMDSLEGDVERLERINRTMMLLSRYEDLRARPTELRVIPILTIRPSQDLGGLASEQFKHFPAMLRHLLRGIGASDRAGWDLMSYLSFDRSYTRPLLELGYADAIGFEREILNFLNGSSHPV